jgi:hypothetical protein
MASDNPLLANLVPHSARRGEYTPEEGKNITIALPGEMLQAKVWRVVSHDAVIAEIDSIPMGKGHLYKKGEKVPCRRIVDDILRAEQWEAVSEHQLASAERAERFEQQEKERLAQEAAPKTALVETRVEEASVSVYRDPEEP